MTARTPFGYRPSEQQVHVLVRGIGGWISAVSAKDRQRMLHLHDHGFMERHPHDSWRFKTTASGAELLDYLETQGVDVTRWIGGGK